MIKNTHPLFEQLIHAGEVQADDELRRFAGTLGVDLVTEGSLIRWPGKPELLDPQAILDHLVDTSAYAARLQLEVHRTIGSTNDLVMENLNQPGDNWHICLAEMQRAGKGRRGRQWVSPFGRNIYLSIGGFYQRSIAELGGLSLVAGMQVVSVLREFGLKDVGLKWPNDVLLGGGKLAGILVELKPPEKRGTGVVIGIGINLAMSTDDAAGIDQAWSAADLNVSRNAIAGTLAASMLKAIETFETEGFSDFCDQWRTYNIYADKTVRVIRGEEEFVGIDRGIDESGNLLLETDNGLEVHNSGEVSMRPLGQAATRTG